MKKGVFAFILCLIGVGCVDEEDRDFGAQGKPKQQEQETSTKSQCLNIRALYSTDHKITPEMAEEELMDVYETFSKGEENGLRKATRPSIASVTAMTKHKETLRSGNETDNLVPDTLTYVFNFSDSAGFAILRADDRIPERVIAYSEKGNLGADDNEISRMITEYVKNYAARTITKHEETKDSLMAIVEALEWETVDDTNRLVSGLRSGNTTTYKGTYYKLLYKVDVNPFIKTIWGQGMPYNYYVRYNECSKGTAPVGCVAIAVGQVAAYYNAPKYLKGNKIDWNSINSLPYYTERDIQLNGTKNLAKLLDLIGNEVNMKYGCEGSKSNIDNARIFFLNNDYSCEYYGRFDEEKVSSAITKHIPVIMRGGKGNKGHEWILDGYESYMSEVVSYKFEMNMKTGEIVSESRRTKGMTQTDFYYHVNWGWDGWYNGYYEANMMGNDNWSYNENQRVLIVKSR